MNTEQYREILDSVRYAINSWKASVGHEERTREAEHLSRAWRRMAYTTQPARLPQRYKDLCQSLWKEAAAILNTQEIDRQVRESLTAGSNN